MCCLRAQPDELFIRGLPRVALPGSADHKFANRRVQALRRRCCFRLLRKLMSARQIRGRHADGLTGATFARPTSGLASFSRDRTIMYLPISWRISSRIHRLRDDYEGVRSEAVVPRSRWMVVLRGKEKALSEYNENDK